VDLIFIIDIAALLILLIGVCWSVGYPNTRIWPPPSNQSWQYYLTWFLFYLVFGLNTLLIFFNWNSWQFYDSVRFIIGIPLILIGAILLIWGIRTLGINNTSGSASGFVKGGPYRFTRNPQYLGDMILFIGLSLCANSLYLWITHILLIMVFIITPIAEEDWLQEQYGEVYERYFCETSRFL
jgi:protein-S-isoprenylcysteine O-methyltransferase Ste14